MRILGIDVGGTFTDAVLLDDGVLRTAKVLTAQKQESSLLSAARAVGAGELDRFTHGTTVATNALLERKGARTAFVGTAGFEHLLHLRRQNRAKERGAEDEEQRSNGPGNHGGHRAVSWSAPNLAAGGHLGRESLRRPVQ